MLDCGEEIKYKVGTGTSVVRGPNVGMQRRRRRRRTDPESSGGGVVWQTWASTARRRALVLYVDQVNKYNKYKRRLVKLRTNCRPARLVKKPYSLHRRLDGSDWRFQYGFTRTGYDMDTSLRST